MALVIKYHGWFLSGAIYFHKLLTLLIQRIYIFQLKFISMMRSFIVVHAWSSIKSSLTVSELCCFSRDRLANTCTKQSGKQQ